MDEIDWESDARVITAARIAHTFHLDPLVVMHGYDRARELEHNEFGVALAIRAACHNIVCAELAAANAAAARKGASGG